MPETIVNRLTWHTAERDQAGIADELANEQEVQEIFGLDDAGLFDEFFCFLRELNIMKVLEQLVPRGHRERKSPVPFSAVMLIYLIRIVAGLKFFYHIGPVLLQSQSIMHIVGNFSKSVGVGNDLSLKIIDCLSDSEFQEFLKRDHHPQLLRTYHRRF